MKDIIFDPHPLLRMVVDEVELPLKDEDKQIMKDMIEFLANSQDANAAKKYNLREGVGLAAPQIGLNKRIIAIRVEDEKGELHEYVFANPKVISHSEERTYLPNGEGCLSVKRDIPGIIPRYKRLRIRGYDVFSNLVEMRIRGIIAVVFQHEIDHLNGKMFYDHIDKKNPLLPPVNTEPISLK